ncbi:MAG: gfo/Idh/MocA family oxidoreductase, partial [Saccharothrix sp.]|nr:gfo/Idh/MocA family oxidoreductase [Saccharothrix sp.]
DFIHLVDTLRLFVPDADDVDVRGSVVDGDLRHVVLRLATPARTGLAIMNRVSGSGGELLQVSGGNRRRDVHNLTDVVDHDGAPTTRRGDDWTPVAKRRGMDGLCRHFLDAVRSGTRLDAGDALRTHELCERIVTSL